MHGNKARTEVICLLIYSGFHISHAQGIYLCALPLCLNRGISFFIIENSEIRNQDGFLVLEFLWVFYQMCKFYHHIDPEKVLLNPNQNFAKIHGA